MYATFEAEHGVDPRQAVAAKRIQAEAVEDEERQHSPEDQQRKRGRRRANRSSTNRTARKIGVSGLGGIYSIANGTITRSVRSTNLRYKGLI